jgi:cobalt-zinc-cadmium efflux system outer membrane protein
LRAEVREAFVELLASQELLAALEAGLSRLGELVEVLRAREREGESSGYDRMRAERERAETEADLLISRAAWAVPRSRLAALTGLPSDGLVAEGSLFPAGDLPAREEALARARARGDLSALDSEAERAERLARAARRLSIPEPALTAGTKTTEAGSGGQTGAVVGVNLSLPLFDRGQGLEAIARAEQRLLLTERAALGRLVDAEAESAHAGALARREAERAYTAAGDPEELVRIARAAYEEGEMRILELLDAYRTALAVQLRAIELHLEARRAEIELMRAIGDDSVSPGLP